MLSLSQLGQIANVGKNIRLFITILIYTFLPRAKIMYVVFFFFDNRINILFLLKLQITFKSFEFGIWNLEFGLLVIISL